METINNTIHGLCGAMAMTGLLYGALALFSLGINIFKPKSDADQIN